MKILKFIGIGIGTVLVLIIGYVLAFAPDKGHVEQVHRSQRTCFRYFSAPEQYGKICSVVALE